MKRNLLSLIALLIVFITLILIRIFYWNEAHHIFTWDSLGYYLYLPSQFIYHDIKHLKWFPEVSSAYQLPGKFYQASMQPNGNYVFFYTMGVAILESPFFFLGHWMAHILNYPQDGFSAPYQISVCFGMIFYSLCGLWFLRKVLLKYFSDGITAAVILLIVLATNFPQYTAIDAGFTHGYLFAAFCFLLFYTVRWHEKPTLYNSFIIGIIIGLCTIIRVTDFLIILIPVLWNTSTKESRQKKIEFIKGNRIHFVCAVLGGFIVILPQLIYWKISTGNFIHQMGSKWDFLLPHYQVLIGWEKGWFIYTPITIFMVAGLFFMRQKEFRKSVVTFFLLNLWLICSWHEWRYAASYSARALMQSSAILSLPLGIFLEKFSVGKWKWLVISIGAYLCFVNLFQIWQYNKTIIHYDDMNRKYYAAIYLNRSPSPMDMSLLDTDERLEAEGEFHLVTEVKNDSIYQINASADSVVYFIHENISQLKSGNSKPICWIKLSIEVKCEWGAYDTYFSTELSKNGKLIKSRSIRMQNGICEIHNWNKIEYSFSIPENSFNYQLKIFCRTHSVQNIFLRKFNLKYYSK